MDECEHEGDWNVCIDNVRPDMVHYTFDVADENGVTREFECYLTPLDALDFAIEATAHARHLLELAAQQGEGNDGKA